MAETKATVDVITAEVRVLSVGSRQVTLSVYNQLDSVNAAEITPFGRVAPKDAVRGYVYIVGRHIASGALVRAYLPVTGDTTEAFLGRMKNHADEADRNTDKCKASAEKARTKAASARERAAECLSGSYRSADRYDRDAADYDAKAEAAETELERLKNATKAAENRATAAERRAEAEAAEQEAEAAEQEAAGLDSNADAWRREAGQRAQKYSDRYEAVAEMSAAWCDLPLIVLAGLR